MKQHKTPNNDQDQQLRTAFERATLRRLIKQLQDDEIEPEMICKYLHAYCELKKNDIAAEKNRSAQQSTKNHSDSPFAATTDGYHFRIGMPQFSPIRALAGDLPNPNDPHLLKEIRENFQETIRDLYGVAFQPTRKPQYKKPTRHSSTQFSRDP